jgi:transketolase
MSGETMTMTAKQDDGRPNPGALTLDPADFRHRLDFLNAQARAIRRWTIALSGAASVGHVGAALSSVDLFTGLYFHQLRVNPLLPDWAERDRFILAHADVAAALYATLGARGFLRMDGLWSRLKTGHAPVGRTLAPAPGVDLCTGSLGYGLAVGAGLALSARRHGVDWRTIVMLSDEECHSNSTWNPARAAAHMKLDRLIAIVTTQGMHVSHRDRGVGSEKLAADWDAQGWHVVQTDGHDLGALCGALEQFVHVMGKPGVLIANTVPGKGVSFLEHGLASHDRPLMPAETDAAIEELA